MINDLTPYRAPKGESALFKNLPMSAYTPEFRALMRAQVKATTGMSVQFKFRGPRNTMVDLLCRSRYSRQSNCIKASATSFAVYAWQPYQGR